MPVRPKPVRPKPPLKLGTLTKWGKVGGVQQHNQYEKRYYWLIDTKGEIRFLPADVVEAKVKSA